VGLFLYKKKTACCQARPFHYLFFVIRNRAGAQNARLIRLASCNFLCLNALENCKKHNDDSEYYASHQKSTGSSVSFFDFVEHSTILSLTPLF